VQLQFYLSTFLTRHQELSRLTMMPMMKLFFVAVAAACASAFSPIRPILARSDTLSRTIPKRQTFRLSPQDDDDAAGLDDATNKEGGFDAPGFAGYLAPYALAVIASVGATAVFVKFVMMDY
jgi:hypothetical protein